MPLSRIGSSCLSSSAEWGYSEAQEQQRKACSVAAAGEESGGVTLGAKAIAKGSELGSVQYFCLRDQGEQLALREDGEPAQVRSGPDLFPSCEVSYGRQNDRQSSLTDDTKTKLSFSRQWKTSCPGRGFPV